MDVHGDKAMTTCGCHEGGMDMSTVVVQVTWAGYTVFDVVQVTLGVTTSLYMVFVHGHSLLQSKWPNNFQAGDSPLVQNCAIY